MDSSRGFGCNVSEDGGTRCENFENIFTASKDEDSGIDDVEMFSTSEDEDDGKEHSFVEIFATSEDEDGDKEDSFLEIFATSEDEDDGKEHSYEEIFVTSEDENNGKKYSFSEIFTASEDEDDDLEKELPHIQRRCKGEPKKKDEKKVDELSLIQTSKHNKSSAKLSHSKSATKTTKAKVRVRFEEPAPELYISDQLNNNKKKCIEFKLVSSNIYKTCSCRGLCRTGSCACVGYLQECQDRCKCSKSCSNMALTRGEEKLLELAESQVHGTGCFADEDIGEGDFVAEYVGEIVSNEDAVKNIQNKYLFTTGDKNFVIDASRFGSKVSRMNHKDEKTVGQNCEFRLRRVRGEWRVGVWALQDISKGEELYADYGEQYWGAISPSP